MQRVKNISVPHLTNLHSTRRSEPKHRLPNSPKKSLFVIFTLADVLSLAFALASVMAFLSILTSSFQFKDFKQSLPQRLMLGVTLLIISCVNDDVGIHSNQLVKAFMHSLKKISEVFHGFIETNPQCPPTLIKL
ncbi:hypothetical protein Acr_15g0018550 [Actinidia rufa]|uniref:Uncharacterized protein n=1 Tax=Actinidia rufa TaxID=165716 RepID=A0A7J0FXP3_9ERIC|nr:hypothetical protein Acr_15g0018550 [Actinidia rufa]